MRCSLFVLISLVLLNLASAEERAARPRLVLDAGGHTADVNGLLFAPDGTELISVSRDNSIRVWDAETGDELDLLRPPVSTSKGREAQELLAAAISPNGDLLAVGGTEDDDDEFPIYLISLDTGEMVHVLRGHTDTIQALSFSPTGKLLASGSMDESARLWNISNGNCEHTLTEHEGPVRGIAFSPNGKKLVTVSDDNTGLIWSVKTGESIGVLEEHDDCVMCVAWSPDGKLIATGSMDQSICLWDANGDLQKSYDEWDDAIFSVNFTPNSESLLFIGNGECGLLNLNSEEIETWFDAEDSVHDEYYNVCALSPDGSLVAAANNGDSDYEIRIWSTDDASEIFYPLQSEGQTIWSAAWSQDGKSIAWGNTNLSGEMSFVSEPLERSFHLAEMEIHELNHEAPAKSSFQSASEKVGEASLEMSDDGSVVAKLRGEKRATVELEDTEFANCFALLSDGQAVVGEAFGALRLFDTRTGKVVHKFQGHESSIRAVVPSPDQRYLLSASADQTLRIWKLDREEPLLSLFFAGDEWIAWTPEGYYAASPNGEDLMGWHVHQGPDKMARFYPASQFHKSLYRPDVIGHLLDAGSVELAMSRAAETGGIMSQVKSLEDVLPPFVLITSPDTVKSETNAETVEVRFIAKSVGSNPLTSARLWINGRPYPGPEGLKTFAPPRLGEVRDAWTVRLAPGVNAISVKAESTVSNAVSEPISVTRSAARGTRRVDPSKPEELKATLPSLYVLAIGVSAYRDSELTLNYCGKDAEAIAKTFQDHSQALYRDVVVKSLTDEQATRVGILKELDAMKKRMTENDVVVFFFAGHGDKDADGKFYLLPVDVDKNELLATAIPGVQLVNAFEGSRRVILMLDACHSGAVSMSHRTDTLASDLKREYGIITMCSSRGRERSLESATEGHGYFTKAIVEGLSGVGKEVRKNPKGEIGVNQLNAYTELRVQELSQGLQTPVFGMPQRMSSFSLTKP